MRQHTFSIPYSVVEKLPAQERFLYYELCRLAAQRTFMDEDFKVQVPRGALISSTLRLSKILDYSYSLTAKLIESLVEKSLIELTPIDTESKVPTFFLIRVSEVYASYPQ